MINKDIILKKYRKLVNINSSKAREVIKKCNYKDDYYLLLCIAQTYLDESRFEDDDSLRKKVNWLKWRLAEKYIIKAFEINSEHAEVLYTMGEIRKLNNQDDLAIYCFKKIVSFGVKKIAFSTNGRGEEFAKELINDSRFELYRLFYEIDPHVSKKYLIAYKRGVRNGISTIFKPLNKFLLN